MSVKKWRIEYLKMRSSGFLDNDQDSDLALALFLDAKRKKLLTTPRYGHSPVARAEGRRVFRRHSTYFLSQVGRIKGRRRRTSKNLIALLFKPSPAIVRDGIYPEFTKDWIPMRRRMSHKVKKELDFKNFSFAKNPFGTMELLHSLAEACTKYPDLNVNFVDTVCDDVTPYIVLSHLSRSLPPIISGGKISHEVSEVVDAVAMRSALRIGTIGRKYKALNSLVSAFRLVDRDSPSQFADEQHLLKPQLKEKVADRFCDTLNTWLRKHELELTPNAEGSFVRAIGEALDNAERHGSANEPSAEGDWSIAGFSKLIESDGKLLLRCSVGIVSVGATISDSLHSAADEVKSKIDGYVNLHSPFFQDVDISECLRTVMALQDGITRVEKATIGRRGGVGFMELVEIFNELGANALPDMSSNLTIISGKACVKVTHPFNRGIIDANGLRKLWFNDGNDDNAKPCSEHVMSLPIAFPGVILSACFTIDPDYLRGSLTQ